MAEILPNSPNDVASRGVTNTTLAQFKGLARQVVINIDDGFRPVIMDGLTLGGKFFCASKAEVEAVKVTAQGALTKTQADRYYLGKTAKATSAGSADTATSAGKWTTARTLTLSGGATGSVSIDGSTNVTLNVTSIAGAKVTGTVSSATTANSVAWTNVSGKPDPVVKSGARGNLAGYEETATGNTVSATSRDCQVASGTVTVSNGTASTAWTKVVKLGSAVTVNLGSSFKWANGEAPEIKAPAILVCHWNNDAGIAMVTNGVA